MSDTIFPVKATWTGGGLTSADIGRRILEMLQQLGPLDPAMSNWLLLNRPKSKWVTLSEATPIMTALVERNVWRDDFSGRPDPDLGYGVVAKGSRVPSEFGASDSINISMDIGSKWSNRLEFEVGDLLKSPDLSLVTYPIYKGALEALAAVWPCPWAYARAFTTTDDDVLEWDGVSPLEDLISQAPEPRPPFETAWIAYLSAPLAGGLTPPPEIASERTPGGGLILSAVRERLDPANPEHMRRARMLQAIMTEQVGVERWTPSRPAAHAANLPARVGSY
jgi:hypothetical protein